MQAAPTAELGLCIILASSLIGLLIIATSPIFRAHCLRRVATACGGYSKSELSSVKSCTNLPEATKAKDLEHGTSDLFEEIPLGDELSDEHHDVRCA